MTWSPMGSGLCIYFGIVFWRLEQYNWVESIFVILYVCDLGVVWWWELDVVGTDIGNTIPLHIFQL